MLEGQLSDFMVMDVWQASLMRAFAGQVQSGSSTYRKFHDMTRVSRPCLLGTTSAVLPAHHQIFCLQHPPQMSGVFSAGEA